MANNELSKYKLQFTVGERIIEIGNPTAEDIEESLFWLKLERWNTVTLHSLLRVNDVTYIESNDYNENTDSVLVYAQTIHERLLRIYAVMMTVDEFRQLLTDFVNGITPDLANWFFIAENPKIDEPDESFVN